MHCAALAVPVDWARPGGRSLTLALARLPHTGPTRRIGTVFAIPGGPGAPGIADLARAADSFSGLRERFDVVTFDPRNLLTALPPVCLQPGPVQVPPVDPVEFARLAAADEAVMERCRAADPELVDHLDSASVARDIEAVRGALGEPELSLIGSSYGGVPAVAYARLFPDRVRAVLLDGAGYHAAPSEIDRVGYQNLEESFGRFVDWCAATSECALHGEDVPALWQAVITAADQNPVPVPGAGPESAYSGLDLKFHAPIFFLGAQWAEFADAVDRARHGDASGFAERFPLPKQPFRPGPSAIHCQDGIGYTSYDEYREAWERAQLMSPNFASGSDPFRLPCAGWRGPVANPPAPLPIGDLPPFLGVGSWTDATITEAAAGQVPGSVTVRYDGPGHVLYQSGIGCVIEHANRYLIDMRLPASGTVCMPER
jgi:pimeloyl-ACP methyl ester carboxylesterase